MTETPYKVSVQRFVVNGLLCWHSKMQRRVLKSSNDWTVYCSKCQRKVAAISEVMT